MNPANAQKTSLLCYSDLVAAFATLPQGLDELTLTACEQHLAQALGFDLRPERARPKADRNVSADQSSRNDESRMTPPPAGTEVPEPTGDWPGRAQPSEFHAVTEYERTAGFGESTTRQTQAVLNWRKRPGKRPPFRPVAPWSEIEPRLRNVFSGRRRGQDIDVDKAVLWAAEIRVDQPVPLRHRRTWGQALAVIVDDSKRMEPYRTDFHLQLTHLMQIFGAGSVAWFYASAPDDISSPKRFTVNNRRLPEIPWCRPPAGTPVLVLGDLGLLDATGPALMGRWRKFGEQLRRRGCIPLALLPGNAAVFQDWDPEKHRLYLGEKQRLQQVFQMLRCQSQSTLPGAVSERVRLVNRLAAWLAFLVRVEPQLLRRLRLLLPGGTDAAIEAAVWQHPLLIGHSTVAATPGTGTAPERLLCSFEQESPELRNRVLQAWRCSRSHTAAEIYLEELGRLSDASSSMLPQEDREDMVNAWRYLAEQTIAAAALAESFGDDRRDPVAAYAKRAVRRSIGDLEVKAGISEAVSQIRSILEGRDQPPPSPGEHVVEIWQQGSSLTLRCLTPSQVQPPALPRQSLIGTLRKRASAVRVLPSATMEVVQLEPGQSERIEWVASRRLQIRSDSESLTLQPIPRPAWADAAGRDGFGLWAESLVGTVRQRWRWIPPGSFQMGSPDDEPGRWDDEGPRHWVTLTRGFWMMDTPCTQALWEAVLADEQNPSRFQDAERPVECVSWEDVQRFVGRLNGLVPDLDCGLPTEAQWEYACRAGSETALYRTAGSSGEMEILGANNAPALDSIAWYGGNSGVEFDLDDGADSSGWDEKQYPHVKAGTRKVSGKTANGWGLYDMLGNVWEWCADSMRDYGADSVVDPVGASFESRAIRGGSWFLHARCVRCACRRRISPRDSGGNLGFRLVRVQDQG